MGRYQVMRRKRSGKAQAFFLGKDGKKPLFQKILLVLILFVLLVGAYLVYRDASNFQQQGHTLPAVSSSTVP